MTDATANANKRIASIKLDEKSVVRRNPDVEHERAVAIYDLQDENYFGLVNSDAGPFNVRLGLEDTRLFFDIRSTKDEPIDRVTLSLTGLRGLIRDYFTICESYFTAIKRSTPSQIEAIDMGRRGLHNEAAETLMDRLSDKLEMDLDTARRLFTLICVLHIR